MTNNYRLLLEEKVSLATDEVIAIGNYKTDYNVSMLRIILKAESQSVSCIVSEFFIVNIV